MKRQEPGDKPGSWRLVQSRYCGLAGGCGRRNGFEFEYLRNRSSGTADVGTVSAVSFGRTSALVEYVSLC